MEWKTVKISDIAYIINGGTPKTSIPEYWDGDIPWLSVKDFNTGLKYVSSAEKHITQEGLEHSATNLLEPEDIIISARGTIGVIAMLSRQMAFNQSCFGLRARNFDANYLYYLLKEKVKELQGQSQGSVFDTIVRATFDRIECVIPATMDDQRRIAAILSSLDDKIENNNRINRNLEAQAQALFKSWFVDFEPFNDGKLVESELGFIPAKWHIESFSSLINFQEGPGIRNWQYVTENGTKFINIRCIKDGDIFTETANMISNEEANGKYAHFMLREGDIVMSCSGTLGRYAIVRKDHLPLCLNTSVIRFFPIYKNDYSYIWGLLTSSYFLNKQIEMAAGSVQANFGPTHLKQIKILVPDEINREQFNKICYPILFEIQRRRYENKRLAALRDTLLPKLMRGEITL